MAAITAISMMILYFQLFYCGVLCQPVHLSFDSDWHVDHHPFPEMNRFLNSHSNIHQRIRPKSEERPYSFLGYLCSIADNDEKIEEILMTFGEKYRPLITKIIENDCYDENEQSKRTMTHINHPTSFPRLLVRARIDHQKPDAPWASIKVEQ